MSLKCYPKIFPPQLWSMLLVCRFLWYFPPWGPFISLNVTVNWLSVHSVIIQKMAPFTACWSVSHSYSSCGWTRRGKLCSAEGWLNFAPFGLGLLPILVGCGRGSLPIANRGSMAEWYLAANHWIQLDRKRVADNRGGRLANSYLLRVFPTCNYLKAFKWVSAEVPSVSLWFNIDRHLFYFAFIIRAGFRCFSISFFSFIWVYWLKFKTRNLNTIKIRV